MHSHTNPSHEFRLLCGVLSEGACLYFSLICLTEDISQLLHWSREEHHLFPTEFRAVVWHLVRGHYSMASVLNTLPMDVLELVIAHLARNPYSFIATPCPAV
jgi:hypothetical protein